MSKCALNAKNSVFGKGRASGAIRGGIRTHGGNRHHQGLQTFDSVHEAAQPIDEYR